ncbi:hypothetical protein OSB04_017849 [Centaurea solstitialis]|uniref:Polyprotein n=1 Tax=Centaurea solstitialis TaxID=347529 RepID=A0AA38WL47_9ASTR|nr:hypothetical protein OSB04_017849 [Centaurea solstitialis]
MASTVTSTNNLSLRSILEKDKLTGSNFLDWERNLMIVLRHERKWYVLEEPLGEAPPANAPAAARNAHKKHSDDLLDVACLMLATMSPDLQTGLINTNAYDMIRQLRDMFQTQARTERYDATKAFNECKMVKGTSVSDHVMKMKRHLDHLERLGHPVPLQLATDTILNSLSEDYRPFVVNYNMNNMEKTIAELHSMLKTAELNMGNKNKTKDVLMVKDGGVKKKNGHASTSKGKGPVQAIQSAPKKGKGKGKGKKVKPNKARTENRCFICNEIGHWRQNCPKRHEAGSYDQLLNNSYKCCRLKVAQIFDRVANIGRDPRLRLLLGKEERSLVDYGWTKFQAIQDTHEKPNTNYMDWMRNLRFTLRYESKEYVLDEQIPTIHDGSTQEEIDAHQEHYDDANKVSCIMASSMSPELQKTFENTWAYEMNQQLKEMFQAKASKERLDVVKSVMTCKPKPGASICAFVLEMKGYFDRLESLNMVFDTELSINMILSGLPAVYNQFVLSYQMNGKETSIMELHSLLQTAKQEIKKSDDPSTSAAPVLAIGHSAKKRKTSHSNWKGKALKGKSNHRYKRKSESEIAPTGDPKEAVCFYCNTKGHWKRSCQKYLKDLKDGKVEKSGQSGMFMIELHNTTTSNSWILDTGCGNHICTVLQGLKESRGLKHGELNLVMGNKKISPVTRIGKYELMLKSGVKTDLNNCCYSSEMTRNIISFHALFKDGYRFSFNNENGYILVYSNGCFIFKASPCKGIYETVEFIDYNGNLILNVGSSNEIDKSKLWHSRLGHINKKHIAQLQKDGVLESFDLKSDDVCESCLLGKMTKSPFTGSCERGEGLLDLVHTDVCGPFRSATKDGKRYYVTFTDDFSRYGYVYLIKHRLDTFEVFKRYQNEVENQLGRKIKVIRSDRGGKYLSIEFFDHLRSCGIVSQLTPPRTPQLNGVAERRNRTLLDMVRSMMSRATLPISFWGYALETGAHILNLVPTKKVSKTPFEMWKGKCPSLNHIKIWGCEVFVRRETQDKLEARSEKCLFIGYPQESFGYLFYKPKDNIVFVARRGKFLEREMISKEDSGRFGGRGTEKYEKRRENVKNAQRQSSSLLAIARFQV